MTALAALQRTSPEPEAPPRMRKTEEHGAFHDEIQHAKREPAKSAGAPKDKRPRTEDPDAPVPEVQAVKVIDIKREIADIARAVSFAPVAKPASPELEAVIQQAAVTATQQVAQTAAARELPPMTPLERAVHDLIDKLRDVDVEEEPVREPAPTAIEGTAIAPAAPALVPVDNTRETARPHVAAPVREPDAELPQPVNPSHVHLVIDDGERLVVTVAVRGENVLAHVRGGDDSTLAMLARNAATLDNMMRARGLQLTDFQASRDGSSDTGRDPREPDRDPREPEQPKFILEETP